MCSATAVKQPSSNVLPGDPAINGTMFIALTDTDLFVSPYNLSLINDHIVAGPALYVAFYFALLSVSNATDRRCASSKSDINLVNSCLVSSLLFYIST